jgi:hypothetical protein
MLKFTTAIAALIAGIASAAAQEPMFRNQYPLVPQPLNRSTLEELTSYSSRAVAPGNGPDASKPELFNQLPHEVAPKVVLYRENGGQISDHSYRFRTIGASNAKVEVRDDCMSACTFVVSYVKRENLCFGQNASLYFHAARNAATREPSPQATEFMYLSYPDDIRAWMDSKGGWRSLTTDGWLRLDAKELWKMGYRRCGPG